MYCKNVRKLKPKSNMLRLRVFGIVWSALTRKAKRFTPVFTWAETRPAKYVQTLRDKLNESEIHNRTGARFHSSYWTAKLLWLRNERKEVFEKTAKWLSFSDYVALKLFG